MKNRYLIAAIWTALIVIPDQITKALVQKHMPLWSSDPVIPGFFNLTHVLNKGAAFGFLNSTEIDWQTPFFIVVGLLAVFFIIYLLKTTREVSFLLCAGLGAIIGGATGNLIDRIRLKSVVDFLDFYVGSYHWPAFNVADIGITMGAAAVILSLYLGKNNASDSD